MAIDEQAKSLIIKGAATLAVDEIIEDLNDRRGLKGAWRSIDDDDTYRDIRAAWRKSVEDQITKAIEQVLS